MRLKDKCSLIYSVDDEPYTVHVWYQFEAERIFPNVSYGGSNRIEEAIEHCKACREPTLYVLDSHMPVSSAAFTKMTEVIEAGLGINIDEFRGIDVLTGVFGAASVKLVKSKTKVILLTAFYKEIAERKSDPRIKTVFEFGCDQMLAKPCKESDVINTVAKYIR